MPLSSLAPKRSIGFGFTIQSCLAGWAEFGYRGALISRDV
jgi:hypothetical protein